MSLNTSIAECSVCGQVISPDHDLDPEHQAYFALHLQACALSLQVNAYLVQARIANALEAIVEHGLLMRMEGRLPDSAPEHFKDERAQALYRAAHSEGSG